MTTPPHPGRLVRARRLARAAAGSALTFACALPAFAAPDWDMVGVRLGMTEAEVAAAFRAFDPQAKVGVYRDSFTYHDGVGTHRTPTFLSGMELRATRMAMYTPLRVWFSGPVGEARVIGVARSEINLPNPASKAQFVQGLQTKYGAPTTLWGGHSPYWEEKDKASCTRTNVQDRRDLGELPQVSTGHKTLAQAVALLEARQQQPGGFYMLPADLERCGAFMYYVSGDPVISFVGAMYDVGAIVATLRSRQAWVEKLKSEAIRKRQGQGQAPRL